MCADALSLFSPSDDRALKTKLLQLECHFTWALTKENVDLSDLQSRLEDQIELDLGKKVRQHDHIVCWAMSGTYKDSKTMPSQTC